MRTRHLLAVATALILLSCTGCNEHSGSPSYKIIGKIPSLPDSTYVFLMDQETKHMDTSYSIGGLFQFEGQVVYPRLVDVIAVDLSNNMMLAHEQLFLENDEIIVGEKDGDTFVTGSKTEEIANQFHSRRLAIIDSCQMLLKQENLIDAEGRRMIGCSQRLKTFQQEFYRTHSDTYFTGYKLASATISMDYDPWDPAFTKSELQAMFDLLSSEIKISEYGQKVKNFLTLAETPQIGDTYIDLEMTTTKGALVKWSELTNDLTLIDLWASWCGPCRLQNPELISVDQVHKNDGFTIVGVSIDSDQEAWLAAIDKDQLPWENLIDKGKWTSNVAQQYEVNSIPDNILIDSNGVIIRRDIRVGELQIYLEERKAMMSW